jgi:exopolysaccharide production protein ExoQ
MKRNIEFVEQIFTILSLVMYTGGIFSLVISGGADEGEAGDADYGIAKQVFILINLVTIFLLTSRWKKVAEVIGNNKYVLLFTGLAIVSTLWSDTPDKTLSRSIGLLGTNLFGLYLATRYTLKEQLLLLVKTFATILLISLLFVVFLPKYGIMSGTHAGDWRGIYLHKNFLGRIMVVSTITFLLQSISYNKHRSIMYLGLIFSIIFLLMSKSSSSIINLLILLIVFFIFRTWRWRYEIMIPVSIAIIFLNSVFYIWFDQNAAIIFASFSKDTSLTGRTDIWISIIEMAFRRAWLGYGYDSFWLGFDGPSAEVWYAASWHPPHAHNGFLDLWLSLGLLGLILLSLSFIDTLSKGFFWLRYSNKTPDGFLPLIFMTFLILSNLTESALMKQNDILTVLYVAISYSLIIVTSTQNRNIHINSHYGE